MGWGIFTHIFGAIAIVSPLCVIPWYWMAARHKFLTFKAQTDAPATDSTSPGRSSGSNGSGYL